MVFDPKRVKLARRGLLAGGGALALSAFLEAPASAAGGSVAWNTGATDTNTTWTLERQ